jgi:hypothetical protein
MADEPDEPTEESLETDVSRSEEPRQPEEAVGPEPEVRWPSEDIGCSFTRSGGAAEEQGEWYLESDHLAMRVEAGLEPGTETLQPRGDLPRLLEALAVLEAQKVQAVRDVEQLLAGRAGARADPLGLVARLQRGEGLGLPGPQRVEAVPGVEWGRYSQPAGPGRGAGRGARGAAVGRGAGGELLVRGRVFQTHKPVTFNQPWTREEQQRLERLLERHPSEETEMERWKKIAVEMGNRTAVQVQRVEREEWEVRTVIGQRIREKLRRTTICPRQPFVSALTQKPANSLHEAGRPTLHSSSSPPPRGGLLILSSL